MRKARVIVGTVVTVGLMMAACACFSTRLATLPARSVSESAAMSAVLGALALACVAQAVLALVVIPAVYKPRTIYTGAAACLSLLGALAGVSAVALALASR